MNFSEKQIRDFKEYRRIQLQGNLNMFMDATTVMQLIGCTQAEYHFIMKNYVELKKAA